MTGWLKPQKSWRLEVQGGGGSLGCPGGLSPWPEDGRLLTPSSQGLSCMDTPGVSSASYKDICPIGLQPHPLMSLSLNHLLKGPAPNTVPLGARASPYGFGGDTVQSTADPMSYGSLTIGSQHLFVGTGRAAKEELDCLCSSEIPPTETSRALH